MKDKKNLLILLLLLLLLGGGYYYFTESKTPEHVPAKVEELPPTEGVTLTIPNTDKYGNAHCKPAYNGSVVENGVASKNYERTGACDPVDILHIPIDGPCPIDPTSGVIGAPYDWTQGCSFKGAGGGLSYLGHSVRGPHVGAFERIHELQVGQLVEVEGKTFAVAAVGNYPVDGLPNRLWEEGSFSLITCYLPSQAPLKLDKKGNPIVEPITLDTVVELTDKL